MITIFDVSEIGLYNFCCKMINFSIAPLAYNGRGLGNFIIMTDMTSDDLYETSDIYKMCVPGGLLLSESFVALRKIVCHWQHCEDAKMQQ